MVSNDMTIQKAIRNLKILIEHRQKVLNMMKEHVNKMQSDSGKELGTALIQVTENDLSNLRQILGELSSLDAKSGSKRKKKST